MAAQRLLLVFARKLHTAQQQAMASLPQAKIVSPKTDNTEPAKNDKLWHLHVYSVAHNVNI